MTPPAPPALTPPAPPLIPVPENLIPLSGYPGYGIRPCGEVWRTEPPVRGRYAGSGPRQLVPVIHPRGHGWAVFVVDPEGRRKRVPIRALLRDTFGVDSPASNP